MTAVVFATCGGAGSVAIVVRPTAPVVEAPLPTDGPTVVFGVPVGIERPAFRSAAAYWDAYLVDHPGPRALRQAAAMHVAWADEVFDDEATAALVPYVERLQQTDPKDCYGVWIVARGLHIDQRFDEAIAYLMRHLGRDRNVYIWWLELAASSSSTGRVSIATMGFDAARTFSADERGCEGYDPTVSPLVIPAIDPVATE